MLLLDKKCAACSTDQSPLKEEEISKYQKELKTPWDVSENKKIKKEFVFNDFREAMKFINKVADIAEEEGHHPDIYIFYNKVVIELWTHEINGLSENDFILASKIENL